MPIPALPAVPLFHLNGSRRSKMLSKSSRTQIIRIINSRDIIRIISSRDIIRITSSPDITGVTGRGIIRDTGSSTIRLLTVKAPVRIQSR